MSAIGKILKTGGSRDAARFRPSMCRTLNCWKMRMRRIWPKESPLTPRNIGRTDCQRIERSSRFVQKAGLRPSLPKDCAVRNAVRSTCGAGWKHGGMIPEEDELMIRQAIRPPGCLRYVVASRSEAVIVDPLRHIDEYLRWIKDKGLKVVTVLDTHVHADRIGGDPFGRAAGSRRHPPR